MQGDAAKSQSIADPHGPQISLSLSDIVSFPYHHSAFALYITANLTQHGCSLFEQAILIHTEHLQQVKHYTTECHLLWEFSLIVYKPL